MSEAVPALAPDAPALAGHRIVFLDTEFTGEHAATTLVSLGLVTLDGRELHVALDDYAEDQVTDWLRENVLTAVDPAEAVPSDEAYRRVAAFLEGYADDGRLYVVSAGLAQDLVLFLELFRHARPGATQFHALHDLPAYLSHYAFIDLNTMFRTAGIAPPDRAAFAGTGEDVRRHDPLEDARIVRACFLKLAATPAGRALIDSLEH